MKKRNGLCMVTFGMFAVMILIIPSVSMAQSEIDHKTLPGSVCVMESASDQFATGLSYEYGYMYNRDSSDNYAVCPLVRDLNYVEQIFQSVSVVVIDGSDSDSVDCWVYSRNSDGSSYVSGMSLSGISFEGYKMLYWTNLSLHETMSMQYIRCLLPADRNGGGGGPSVIRSIGYTEFHA